MTAPYYQDDSVTLYQGDALDVLSRLPDGSVDCCVTSPPYYGLRDYGIDGQYGLEATPAEFVARMVAVFAQVRRVLAPDGTLWLNLGDSYAQSGGHTDHGSTSALQGRSVRKMQGVRNQIGDRPPKNLLGMPWRVAFALQDDGWILRNAVIWHKPNAMPESVTDRLSTRYEHLFLLTRSRRYWFDLDAIREPLKHPDAADGTRVFGGKQGGEGKVGSSYRTAGGMPNRYGKRRLEEEPRDGAHEDTRPGGRNPGDVWTLPTQPFTEAHFATYPEELARRAVAAGCPVRRCTECGQAPIRLTETAYVKSPKHGAGSVVGRHDVTGANGYDGAGMPRVNAVRTTTGWTNCEHDSYRPGIVLDLFSGSGTTGLAAARLGRRYVGIDLNAEYLDLSLRTRLAQAALDFEGAAV